MEVFNLGFAYFFLVLLQIFNQKHNEDFTEEDKTIIIDVDTPVESDLFISPVEKQIFGWVALGILGGYLTTHMTFFTIIMVKDTSNKCKARCAKRKAAKAKDDKA